MFTIITFPFLFAVMFGDIGHGLLMTLSALSLIAIERKYPKGFGNEVSWLVNEGIRKLMNFDSPRSPIPSTLVATLSSSWVSAPFPLPTASSKLTLSVRQVFAIYTGFIYNDIFSLSFHLAESQFRWPSVSTVGEVVEGIQTASRYPFGIDPAWHAVDNALIFTNSLKMKMSIVLGVIHVRSWLLVGERNGTDERTQMTFAICLQVPNHLHFKRPEMIWAEFLPQLLFMESIFGYLIGCIVYVFVLPSWCEN